MTGRGGSVPNILVTGGAGFIGSHTAKLLAGSGFRRSSMTICRPGTGLPCAGAPLSRAIRCRRNSLSPPSRLSIRPPSSISRRRPMWGIRRGPGKILPQQCLRHTVGSGSQPPDRRPSGHLFLQLRHLWHSRCLADPRRRAATADQSLWPHQADRRTDAGRLFGGLRHALCGAALFQCLRRRSGR